MTTAVVDRVPSTQEWHEPDATNAGPGVRRLPTAAQVMFRAPKTIAAQTSLFSAWGQLHGDHGGHVVVVDSGARPIGVLDERDIVLHWPPGPLAAHHTPVHQLLRFRTQPRAVADDDLAQVAATMLGARQNALPVVDEDGRLIGLVTVWHCLDLLAGTGGGHRQGRATSTAIGRREAD